MAYAHRRSRCLRPAVAASKVVRSPPAEMTMDFTPEGLAAEGFAGFVTWNEVSWDEVPSSPGVYVVINDGLDRPEILNRSPAGWFKQRDPTAPRTTLEAAWVEGCTVVYIGKAARLRTRLRQYRDHGQGKPVGHWGGRYIWQLGSSSQLRVAWKISGEDPRLLEQELLTAFLEQHGQLPFANLRR